MHLSQGPVAATSPFMLRTNPARAVAHLAWIQARNQAEAVLGTGGAACVLGPPGTGKSLLLQAIAEAAGAQDGGGAVSFLPHASAASLSAWTGRGGLIADEADTLDDGALDKLLTVARPLIIAGLPSLEPRLAGRGMLLIRLQPLSHTEISRVVAARLEATGRSRDQFDPDALRALTHHSNGLMRLVLTLAGSALFFAEQEHGGGEAPARVMAHHVHEAAAMRDAPAFAAPAAQPMPEAIPPAAELPGPAAASVRPPARFSRVAPRSKRVRQAAALVAFLALGTGAATLGWSLAGSAPPPRPARGTPLAARSPARIEPAAPAAPPAIVGPASVSPASVSPAIVPPAVVEPAVQEPEQSVVTHAVPAPGSPSPSLASPTLASPTLASPAVPPLAPPAPAPPSPPQSATATYRGTTVNETIGVSGRLTLTLRRTGPGSDVRVFFQASAGLLGQGELAGKLTSDGHLTASGPLAMGANTFMCMLDAVVGPDSMSGGATYSRPGSSVAQGRFRLARS